MVLLNLTVVLTVQWIRAETALLTDQFDKLTKLSVPENITTQSVPDFMSFLELQIQQITSLPDPGSIEQLYSRVLALENQVDKIWKCLKNWILQKMVKVLVAGDVLGRIDLLFSRIRKLQSKVSF